MKGKKRSAGTTHRDYTRIENSSIRNKGRRKRVRHSANYSRYDCTDDGRSDIFKPFLPTPQQSPERRQGEAATTVNSERYARRRVLPLVPGRRLGELGYQFNFGKLLSRRRGGLGVRE
ncbi:hypothetical protein E2C01_014634 [Portunus trituberculatus]|uniref:Uncharacterized protein n=1 Tax=Portunus trituberculatus TaxID=210409 RepID=A0A5B7DJD8_PORTR|nr:hypothetical protein [Portunus trituberculatus]